MQKYSSVFIPVAYGETNRGKTKAAEIAVRAAGQSQPCYSAMTDALMKKLLWGGLPFVYDDPSKLDVMKETVMRAFGGGMMGPTTQAMPARCVPLICVNEFLVEALSKVEEAR